MAFLLEQVQLDALDLLYVLFCGSIAGLCRGFAGFGLSALVVTSLTLVLLPVEVVPIALLLEMISSLVMARMTWTAIHWGLLRWLCVGAAIGVPAGVFLFESNARRSPAYCYFVGRLDCEYSVVSRGAI